jgi:hypothetical protein
LEDVLTGTRDDRLAQKLRDSYRVFASGKANGTGSFDLHTQSRVVLRGSRARTSVVPSVPQSLQKTRSLLVVCIARARARLRLFVRMHLHAWHAAAVVADAKVTAHTIFNRRFLRVRLLFQSIRLWRSRAAKQTSIRFALSRWRMARNTFQERLHSAQNGANELSTQCCGSAILYLELAFRCAIIQARDIAGSLHAAYDTPRGESYASAGADNVLVSQLAAARVGARVRDSSNHSGAPVAVCPSAAHRVAPSLKQDAGVCVFDFCNIPPHNQSCR